MPSAMLNVNDTCLIRMWL